MEEMEDKKEVVTPAENRTEFIASAPEPEADQPEAGEKKKKKCSCGHMAHWVVECLLLIAVVVLFILHFCGGKCASADNESTKSTPVKVATKPGNGNILYLNMDTIYECALWKEKQAILDEESDKLEASFTTRQKKLEADAAQFQKNVQAGVLTEEQMQYTYQQLGEADQKIKEDYQTAMEGLAKKQADITEEMMKVLRDAANTVNNAVDGSPASYIITYSSANPTVIVADPTRDITRNVIEELDKKCTPKKTDK